MNEGVNEYIDDEVTLYPSQSGWASCQYQFISFSYKIYALDEFYQSLLSDRSIINGYTSPCDETDGFNLPEVNNPKTFSAYNYPNPFNPVTEIRYSIPLYTLVNIKVYDIIGREVSVLVNEYKTAGNYKVVFDGTNLPSGVYFYKLEAGRYSESKKMVLIK